MTAKRLFLTAACLLALSAPAAADEHAAGRDLYLKYQCWQCHGYEGQGGAAARVARTAYPYEAFLRFVRYPNQMPAYTTELLSDADLRAIYAYLRSIPEPPAIGDIPALDDL